MSAFLRLDSLFSIYFCGQLLVFQHSPTVIGTPKIPLVFIRALLFYSVHYTTICTPQPRMGAPQFPPTLLYWIPYYFPTLPLFGTPLLGEHFSIPIGAALP
jgi:hypothetical protein